MQNFFPESHELFKKEFNIKEKSSQIDLDFLEKTRKYLNLIKWIPWIKMIWVGNSISMNAWTPDSDIDLFIVTSTNRLWIVRILITLIFQILWVRKTSRKHAGRFCLSFFTTDKSLDFSNFAIENDVYLYFRILYFKPILDFDNTYEKFIESNKNWADFSEYPSIIDENRKAVRISSPSIPLLWGEEVWATAKAGGVSQSIILNLVEKLLKKIFLPRTLKTYEKLGKPFWVIINDDMLKFHDKDVRKKISKKLV